MKFIFLEIIKKIASLLSMLIPIFTLNSCLILGNGSDKLVKKIANKEHSKEIVLFLRGAGATIADSYQVSIIDYASKFDNLAIGNVFTVDDNHGKANLNSSVIDFNWISEDTVAIICDKNLRIFIQEKTIDGVTVVYKAK